MSFSSRIVRRGGSKRGGDKEKKAAGRPSSGEYSQLLTKDAR